MTVHNETSRLADLSKVETNRHAEGISKVKDPTKLERVLTYLATGRSLHRFEAEREVNDHCLHSTMSTIKHGLGIPYRRVTESVPGWQGHPTPVTRYWLDEDSQRMAWKHVSLMRKRRGAEEPLRARSGRKIKG